MVDTEAQRDPLLQDADVRIQPSINYFTWPKVCLIVTLIGAFLALPVTVVLVILYAPTTYTLRCHLSDKIHVHVPNCDEPVLLGNITLSREIPNLNLSVDQPVESFNQQDQEYLHVAEKCMETGLQILHHTDSWHKEAGKDLDTGRVVSKNFKNIGKVSKLQAYINASPQELFDLLITNSANTKDWYPTVEKTEVIEKVSDYVDVIHVVSGPLAGGIVSARDYVDVRSYQQLADGVLMSLCSSTHPDAPPNKRIVRGKTIQSSTMFETVDGNPNRVLFQWVVRFEVGGWVPAWAVDNNVASSMMEFLEHLQKKVSAMNRQKNRTL